MEILTSFLVSFILALLLGLALAFSSRALKVEKDKRLEELESVLPGANCGSCGFPGCSGYAKAVFDMTSRPGLCLPGGDEVSKKMSSIMGIESVKKEKMTAYVFCSATCEDVKSEYEYEGIKDCRAASLLFSGPGMCKEGCLRFGSCLSSCPSKAIGRDENGRIVVDKEKCTGCGVCTKVCPTGAIKLVKSSDEYEVRCNSHLSGAKKNKICTKACIGCKICENKVSSSPFKVDSFLSIYSKENGEGNGEEALSLCPKKVIERR